MDTRISAPEMQRIVPSFIVKKLEGTVERNIIVFDKEGLKQIKTVKSPAGYMVSFPTKGHSIRVRDDADLRRLGFDRTIPLVNDNEDDDSIVGVMPNNAIA